MNMQKRAVIDNSPVSAEPSSDDIASWVRERPVATPLETAAEDMRAIAARYAAALGEAFSKLPKDA
jgi:hypothetical protein